MTINSRSAIYKVQPGDTFTKIASLHRIKHWQDIFFAHENSVLRKRIQRPERIQPGDTVIIPKNIDGSIRDYERKRLIEIIRRLNQEKAAIETMFAKLQAENDAASRKLRTFASRVDALASMPFIVRGLINTSKEVAKTIALNGEALKEANKKFVTEFVKDRAEMARDLAAQVADEAIQEPDSVALMVTKSVAVAIGNVTSLSFWAAGYDDILQGRWNPTSWTPQALKEKADQELLRNKASAIAHIDRLIAKYNKAVENLRG